MGKWFLYFFRILKLLNQRKLETLKERWWNQNPQKKVDNRVISRLSVIPMWPGVWGGGRQQWWDLDPQHWRRLHRHLHRDWPCNRHSWSWILVNSPFFTSFSTVFGSYLFSPPGITSIKPHQHESALSRYKPTTNKFFIWNRRILRLLLQKQFQFFSQISSRKKENNGTSEFRFR